MDWTKPIIECVVNVSVGRKGDIINKLSKDLHEMDGVELVHVDIGIAADRTVFTIIGEIISVFETIRGLYNALSNRINVFQYQGNHPTVGVIDVVPFIALSKISEDELSIEVREFAQEISSEFSVPICFYGQMAIDKNQASLSQIRKGGPVTLQHRVEHGELVLDVGERIHETFGLSCWAVRKLMIAYNINLKTKDIRVAKKIAALVRKKRDVNEEAFLQNVKAIGWYVEEYGCCQVSTNLYDINECDMTQVFNLINKLALAHGTETHGSELIGMTPIRGLSSEANFENIMDYVGYLGLNNVTPFIPKERVLELKLNLGKRLWDRG